MASSVVSEGKILINLGQRWPAEVSFDSERNEFVIPLSDSDRAFRLRTSAPIVVTHIAIEKDQVIANFFKK